MASLLIKIVLKMINDKKDFKSKYKSFNVTVRLTEIFLRLILFASSVFGAPNDEKKWKEVPIGSKLF